MRTVSCLLFCTTVIILFQAGVSWSADRDRAEGGVTIEADRIRYDSDGETCEATGSVIITFEGGFLKADHVHVNNRTKDVDAAGSVYIQSDQDILQGEKVCFNVETETGTLFDGSLFMEENNLYIQAKEITKKGKSSYALKEARATTCNASVPDWSFAGREADVTIDGYGTLRHGSFQIRDLPVLYLPYLVFPAKTTRQTGLLFPRIAYSQDKFGWDVEIPFYWNISDESDATFYQRYMDKRGIQEGAEFRYCLNERSHGTLYGDYLNDTFETREHEGTKLERDWQDNQKRWSYYLNTETTMDEGFSLRTDIKKISDIWYFRDFGSYNYYQQHYDVTSERKYDTVTFDADRSLASLDSTVRLVKDWNLFNITGLVQYTDNFQSYSNDETLQRYPEITFTAIKQPLINTPVNVELESRYDYYYRTSGYRGHLMDHHPILSLPLRYKEYFQCTPEIGVRFSRWDASDSTGKDPGTHTSRTTYSIGGTVSTEVERIFAFEGLPMEKIRHIIRPEATYRYIPNVNQKDLPDYVPPINEENSVTYGVTNLFTARLVDEEGTVSYREFLRLKMSQTYDILEARGGRDSVRPDRRPFGVIDMEGELNPVRFFSLDADARFDVNDGEWKRINSALDMEDRRGDSATIEYRYTQDSVEELNLSLKALVSDRLDLRYVLRQNMRDKRYLETTYGLDYHRQCWSLNASYADSSDDRGVMLIFSLYGLGNVGKISGEIPE